ncbi:MAG: InlB B-repeat-containing protein, partial [Oscillospiraceae bacterium]|nr:InlB B-repeat-containing protein [Oscillospiraceae bacterium]
GTVLQSSEVAYGETPAYTGETPTKTATAQYTYTFKGWSPEIAAVTGDATYTAQYDKTVNKYTVTWIVNGTSTEETYEYGATPSFKGSTDKAADDKYSYAFAGWSPEITAVTGNAAYTAQYTETVNEYTVTWNVDGETTTSQQPYDAKLVLPKAPAKKGQAFVGWYTEPDGKGTKVDGNTVFANANDDTVYYAHFTSNAYTLRFTRNNGKIDVANPVLVPYGAKIVEYLPESIATYYENVADAKGKNDFLVWTYAVDGSYQILDDGLTMPAGNMKLVADYLFTGWSCDDTGWTYQIKDVVQKTGWTQIHEVNFTANDTGSAWYYLDPVSGYRATDAVRVPYPTTTVNGNTYAPDQGDIDYAASKGQTFIDAEEGWFLFGTDGKFLYGETGMGTYYGATRYVVKGYFPWHPGLALGAEDYYYFLGDVDQGGNIMATGDVYVTANMTKRNVKLGGVYTFGADGKLCEYDGITDMANGTKRYYIDAQLMMGNGLTRIGDKYIYVRTSGELVVGAQYWVPANSLNVVEGMYTFDQDGFLVNPILDTKDGVYYENGAWVYYEKGVVGCSRGLMQVTENWVNGDEVVSRAGVIYVRSNGQLATGTYYVTNIADTTLGVESGDKVHFDANGLMIVMKNGIIAENGSLYYYKDNVIAYNAGVIQIGGDYYYVRSNGEVVNGRSYWITNVGDSGLVAKQYTFDANGVMQDPAFQKDQLNGIHNGCYYVNGAIAYAAGVVYLEDEGCYIYVRSNGQLATGVYWATNTNDLLDPKSYDWGPDGKLYL